MKTISIIIPTLNGEKELEKLLPLVPKRENLEIIVIDSSSSDCTQDIARSFGAKVIEIDRASFNHGGTRNLAATKAEGDILVFLTQDVVLYDLESIDCLISVFNEKNIGVAYGKQLPHKDANLFSAFARKFNYKSKSSIKKFEDKNEYGIKTVFTSNSFAAYRKSVLQEIGGFPINVILGEDMYVAAKATLAGYSIAYVAEAKVYHSHNYSITQEFQRNFDIGVFHTNENWILDEFSKPEGEGLKFVFKELEFLKINRKFYLIPISLVRNLAKLIGYKLGKNYKKLPAFLRVKLSMYKTYWNYN